MSTDGSLDIDEFVRNLHLFTFLARHSMEGKFVQESTDKQISFVQMNLMRILEQHPGQTVGDIAKFMNVSYPAATKTIDKLVRLGFLRRREDSHDRRIAHLHLTPAGRKTVEKYSELTREQLRLALERFGMERARLLNEHLFRFARAVVDVIPISGGVCMQCGAFDPNECYSPERGKSCGYLDRDQPPET